MCFFFSLDFTIRRLYTENNGSVMQMLKERK
jgi:hypothetical protein